jgi:hypothetical protein
LLGTPAPAQQLRPFDTTDQAPKFSLFREQLQQAVKERDGDFFRSRTKGANLSFGMPVDLDERFHLDDPNDGFWKVMDRLMEMGGVWQADSEMVVYPYAYAAFPKNVDAFTHDVVIGENVPVLQFANPESFEVGELNYDIVWVLERGEQYSRVRADDGTSGYIESHYLYSPVDYRMGLALVDGRWAIVYLVAGD